MLIHEDVTARKHSLLLTFPSNQNGYAKQRHIFVYSERGFVSINFPFDKEQFVSTFIDVKKYFHHRFFWNSMFK